MQRLEKLDTSTIKQEVGNILNKNMSYRKLNSIAFYFWQNKSRTCSKLRTTQKREKVDKLCVLSNVGDIIFYENCLHKYDSLDEL